MRVYLSGPIAGLTYDEANAWRQDVEDKFALSGVKTINPLRGRFFSHADDETFDANEIVFRDLKDVQDCDLMLVSMPKQDRPSIGTICEIWHAYAVLHKPTILVTDDERFTKHPWIKVAVTKIFSSMDDAVKYIVERWTDDDDRFVPERF